MSTEQKKPGKRLWLYPVLLAVPFLAAIAFAAVRFGPTLTRLINAAVKMAVVS